jgi:hypothetical protein
MKKIQESKLKSSSSTLASDPVDELKKFKELLDMCIITQEEFDIKKKQILGIPITKTESPIVQSDRNQKNFSISDQILDRNNSVLMHESICSSDSKIEKDSEKEKNAGIDNPSFDQKAILIQNNASEVATNGCALAYFFFDLRNEITLGNYDLQNDEFLKVYSKYFPDMTLDNLQQLRAQAIPWLNDPKTCNSQYQIIMQDSFEHRYIMIANAWFERALSYEPTQRASFVYNTCGSFFYPQELQTVWERLQGLQQTAVKQVNNMNDFFDISCFMNNNQKLPNAKEIAEYVQAFKTQNPGIISDTLIEELFKCAYIEKMYGNHKREAIRIISNYFGIT